MRAAPASTIAPNDVQPDGCKPEGLDDPVPALVLIITRGRLYMVHAATTDLEAHVIDDLRADLAEALDDLAQAVSDLDR